MSDEKKSELRALATEVVAAFVSNNNVPVDQLSNLIKEVFQSLADVGVIPAIAGDIPASPAVPIKKSITPSAIICLECGKPMQMLRRHLTTEHGLSVDEYRTKWKLSADYPVVAPEYGARRSEFAKKIGLGRKPGKRSKKKPTS